jgi:FHS family L-fucose permease-like MFS transporter
VPVIIGCIGDFAGLRSGVAFLYITLGFVLSVGFWARPMINNAATSFKKESAEVAG